MVRGMGEVAGTAGDPVPGDPGVPVVVERAAGVGGELVLRRAGEHYEIISNGVFLMDTRGGASERVSMRNTPLLMIS